MPHAKVRDIDIEYYVEGSGPPLLMLMGFAGQAASWGEPFLDELRSHFTCIRFSNRGTGHSTRPAEQFTVRDMAEDAIGLLDVLGIERPDVLGISMGGMIAQELVLAHPRRVNRLVLGCTTPGGPNSSPATQEVLSMLLPVPGLSREELVRKAWPAICARTFIDGGRSFLEQMLVQSLANPTPIETLAKQMVAIQSFNAYERLGQIKAPTLVIHGDVDVLVPPVNGKILAERIPGAELRMLPGVAHMFFWEQPRESAEAIVEFLSRVPSAA